MCRASRPLQRSDDGGGVISQKETCIPRSEQFDGPGDGSALRWHVNHDGRNVVEGRPLAKQRSLQRVRVVGVEHEDIATSADESPHFHEVGLGHPVQMADHRNGPALLVMTEGTENRAQEPGGRGTVDDRRETLRFDHVERPGKQ